jgi:hypothetical protein
LIRIFFNSATIASLVACGTLTSVSDASAACGAGVNAQIAHIESITRSLRADKPSQMRVSLPGGMTISNGQASWLKTQLTRIESSCVGNDEDGARALLGQIDEPWLRSSAP